MIIQFVSEPIMAQIANLDTAHEMWVLLKENYYPDTSFSFVHQMRKIVTLRPDAAKPIRDFIRSFEHEWCRLLLLPAGTSEYHIVMKKVLNMDTVKRDNLLGVLISDYPNLVVNITTKDDLTFSQLKIKLYSLSSNVDSSTTGTANTALVVHHSKKRKFDHRARTSSSSATHSSTSGQSCTWCKAHNFRYEGRVRQECRKLKASKTGTKVTPDTAPPTSTFNASAHVAELMTADAYVSHSPIFPE